MVEIQNLSFSYRKRERNPLFFDLSLDLSVGGIYGLLGKNGAGKTTLLRLMSGQLSVDGGRCTVLGVDPRSRTPELLRQVFFLPEEFYVPPISGINYRNVYAPFYPEFDSERFTGLCAEFEIDPAQKLSRLSYGQKKKFLLAFALATGCRLLLLDEPTNGLDIPSKRQLRRSVVSSIGDGQVILVSTHQVRDMENLIDPIVVINDGRIVFFHDIDTVSRALIVSSEPAEPTDASAIYAERSVGGYTAVRRGAGAGSTIDLELLFNAIVASPDRVGEACSEVEERHE